MRALKAAAAAHDALTDAAFVLAVAALAGILGLTCFEVAARYAFAAPTRWAMEIVQALMVPAVFLAVPHVTRAGGHVAVTVVVDSVPFLRTPLRWFTLVAGLVMCLAAAWISLEQNLRQFDRGIVTQGNLPLPKWWFSSAATFGFAGAALYFLRGMIPGLPVRSRFAGE
jgi:C4-dicarboxylate transporter, DctQ subunit